MPLIKVATSQSVDQTRAEEVLHALSKGLSEILGKPERVFATLFVGSAPMTFGGTNEPAGLVEVCNIGTLSKAQTEQMSRFVAGCLSEVLTVKADRVYVLFHEFERHLWGTSSGTFA